MADSKFCTSCQHGDEYINAVSWCSDCSEIVCKICARVHEKISPPHKLVPIKEIQLSSSLLNLSKNCGNHPDQKIVLYCCQHDKVICGSCVTVSHQNCKPIITLKDAAKGVKGSTAISDLERRMDNLSQVTEDMLSHSETTLEDLKKSRNKIKKRVSEIKTKIIAYLDKLEADIHKDIDNKYTQCNETVSRNKDSIQFSADLMSIWKNDLKSLKQHTSEIHLFQAVKFLDARTHQKELEIREIQTATVPTLTYHPSKSEANLKKILPDLGIIMIDNVSVTMPRLAIDQQCQFFVTNERKIEFLLTNSIQTTELGDGVRIYRGCFIPDDRLLLSQYMKKKLIVCKLNGSKEKMINLNYEPQCITLYDNNLAVVSVGDEGIQIIDLTKLKPGRKIKVGGTCRGITCVKDTIWVRNQPNTLTMVDIKGKVLNTIKTTFNLWDICSNKDGDVYCTDNDSNKVYVVTSDGKEREIYNSFDLKNPHGVAVDNHGDVYVAGMESNNIHRISNDRQKHDIVLMADDSINRPTGLSYNYETRQLLVINNTFNTVNIYKMY